MAAEKAARSRCESGVRAAARQMSRMRSGLFSKRRRERAARDFSLLVSGVLESGLRIEVEKRRSVNDRSLLRNAID